MSHAIFSLDRYTQNDIVFTFIRSSNATQILQIIYKFIFDSRPSNDRQMLMKTFESFLVISHILAADNFSLLCKKKLLNLFSPPKEVTLETIANLCDQYQYQILLLSKKIGVIENH